jgi:hypothetical protein
MAHNQPSTTFRHTEKQMRLKQAQEEAEAEVARYKQEREAQFQTWLQQV